MWSPEVQVPEDFYKFIRYMTKNRWASVWHQATEIMKTEAKSVFEVGPGAGILRDLLHQEGVHYTSCDIDPSTKPTMVGSVTHIPTASNYFDCTCAFQVLEHLPYREALEGLLELLRVSKKFVIISLPDRRPKIQVSFYSPLTRGFSLNIPWPFYRKTLVWDSEHHWEIGMKGYPYKKVVADIARFATIEKTYIVDEYQYHRFFVLRKP